MEGPMTPDEKGNEYKKLTANWLNTIATALLTVGTLVPIGQFIFGILPQGIDPELVFGAGVVCFVSAVLIHFGGQWVLRNLR
jgi:hypothetical protein